MGALCAHLRELPVSLGALFGAVLGPVGALAILVLPRRVFGDATATHSRMTRWVPDLPRQRSTIPETVDDPYV
jgi:hypothetical protein